MARTVLSLPDQFFYTCKEKVRITDINVAGHLGNDQMVTLITVARDNLFHDVGLSVANIEGCKLFITDLEICYRAEAFANDMLSFKIGLMDFNKYGADFIYRVTNASDTLIAEAKTGFVFVDNRSKVTPIPNEFMTKIGNRVPA